jgi:ribosomal protein S27AE
MNLCAVHEINNKFGDELFALLCHLLLLKPNCLVANYYAPKALTQKLGLNYENIHACVKGCILFQGDHKDDVNCPKCGSVQYKDM